MEHAPARPGTMALASPRTHGGRTTDLGDTELPARHSRVHSAAPDYGDLSSFGAALGSPSSLATYSVAGSEATRTSANYGGLGPGGAPSGSSVEYTSMPGRDSVQYDELPPNATSSRGTMPMALTGNYDSLAAANPLFTTVGYDRVQPEAPPPIIERPEQAPLRRSSSSRRRRRHRSSPRHGLQRELSDSSLLHRRSPQHPSRSQSPVPSNKSAGRTTSLSPSLSPASSSTAVPRRAASPPPMDLS